MPGRFTRPEQITWNGAPADASIGGDGGSDVLKLDDALAAVDDFVSGKLGL